MNPERSERIEIPVLPLRDVVVYPHMVIPLFVGREKSIRCLEAAMDHDKKIMLVAQKEASTDEPGVNDLFTVGTVASILQMLKLPDGTVKVLVEGLQRARITTLSDDGEHFSAKAEYLDSPELDEREQEVLVRTAISQFEGYIKLNKKIPPEVLTSLNSIDDPARLADTIAAHMPLKLADKQSVLEMSDVNERLEYLMAMMESEIDLLQVEKRIRNRVKKQMEKSQREYYLNEQMKAIQKELGEMDDAPDENEALKRKIDAAKMPKEAKEKAEAELQKLKMMSPMSAEATVVRGYIEWMVQVPWNARSKVKKDLRQAQEILDKMKEDPTADMSEIAKGVDDSYSAVQGNFTTKESEDEDEDSGSEAYPDEVLKVLRGLKDGEVADNIIETDTGYYVVRLDKINDEDATASKRESLQNSKENTYFTDTTAKWLDEADVKAVKKVIKTLKITDKHTFMAPTPTPVPETPTPEVTEEATPTPETEEVTETPAAEDTETTETPAAEEEAAETTETPEATPTEAAK